MSKAETLREVGEALLAVVHSGPSNGRLSDVRELACCFDIDDPWYLALQYLSGGQVASASWEKLIRGCARQMRAEARVQEAVAHAQAKMLEVVGYVDPLRPITYEDICKDAGEQEEDE